jgi:adenylate cyclase class 2
MRRSTREVEIKLPFPSPSAARTRLWQLGATESRPRRFEDNLVFEREIDPLGPAGKLLRLRQVGGRALLTLKTPVPGEHRHKVRGEQETYVEDPGAMGEILRGLGFVAAYRYQKYRTEYALGGLCICLDETPIGCFVELEGRPEDIDDVARRLGFTTEDYIRVTYRDLHESAARARGVAATDLLLETEGTGENR